MLSIIGFLIIIGVLVVVHEFGHYFFARLFNVRADVFSIGFGPKIWSKRIGETDFRIAAIPLGGYVELFGEKPGDELPAEQRARALQYQKPWKRFWIFFGGPLFNFIFASFVFMCILAIGEPQPASVIGRVIENSDAIRAGFQSGDRILEINGKPVTKYTELALAIHDHPAKEMTFLIQRENQKITLKAVPKAEDGYSMYGEEKPVGEIDGLLPTPRSTIVGISDSQSPAAKAGLKTGFLIESINGQRLETWEQIEKIWKSLPQNQMVKVILQDPQDKAKTEIVFNTKKGTKRFEETTGLYSTELFVEKTIGKSPAEAAGIQPGDRLIKVENEILSSFFGLREAIQKFARDKESIAITWQRQGQIMTQMMKPTKTYERDPLLNKVTQYTIGVMPMLSVVQPAMVVERVLNPVSLVYRGVDRMLDLTKKNFIAVWKMIVGDVSVAALGGPILIGKIAGDSLERGFLAFLTTMAILSVGLGILNILPIPVLDGGHILLLLIESIRGKPLSLRQLEIVQQVGMGFILILMVVVMSNDLARVLPVFRQP